ncbi:MAG: tetratricopeptide repeat protein [Candidatus Sumerlaeia bacterium]|nr:tetratricopeptide repeat protein [Candidatus Sumerlaeia bacterium]
MGDDEEAMRAEVDRLMESGWAALENQQYEQAADLFRRIMQRAPFRQDARQGLALALQRQMATENGRTSTPSNGTGTPLVTAASTTGRGPARATRIRVRLWPLVWALVGTTAVVTAASIVYQYGRHWIEGSHRPARPAPAGHPALEKIGDDLRRADNALGREQYDEALRILESARLTALSFDPPDTMTVALKMAAVYAAQAQAFYRKENYDKALEAALEGLKHNPSLAQLHYVVGQSYERKGLHAASANDTVRARTFYQQAAEALEKCVAADPEFLAAWDLLGKTYARFDEVKAIETWQKIVRRAPDTPEGKKARDYLEGRRGFSK